MLFNGHGLLARGINCGWIFSFVSTGAFVAARRLTHKSNACDKSSKGMSAIWLQTDSTGWDWLFVYAALTLFVDDGETIKIFIWQRLAVDLARWIRLARHQIKFYSLSGCATVLQAMCGAKKKLKSHSRILCSQPFIMGQQHSPATMKVFSRISSSASFSHRDLKEREGK